MLGRPAMMIKSAGWSPDVSRSSFSNPVATPVTCSFRSYSRSMYSKVFLRILPTGSALPSRRRSARLKMRRSASSTSVWTSSFASKACVMIWVEVWMSSRRTAMSRTICA